MNPILARTVTAVATSMVIAVAAAPTAGAARVDLGSGGVDVPDIAPLVVPIPAGSEAAPLPPLPYPLVWSRDIHSPGNGPTPVGDAFSGRTVVLDCSSSPQRMPDTIVIACGDGNGQFRDIRWTSWRPDRAEGTAEKVWVDCTPSCHRGIRRGKPVSIALHDVRHTGAGATFASLTSYDDRGARTVSTPGFPYRGDWMFP